MSHSYFFDTSALIKKYISEKGSKIVDEIFMQADLIYVSPVTIIEMHSTLSRLLHSKHIKRADHQYLLSQIEYDFQYFQIVSYSIEMQKQCLSIIAKHKLKTLDSIQLGSALALRKEYQQFICCDDKLTKAARKEKLDTIDPLMLDTNS